MVKQNLKGKAAYWTYKRVLSFDKKIHSFPQHSHTHNRTELENHGKR
jgi:hypothetical protein